MVSGMHSTTGTSNTALASGKGRDSEGQSTNSDKEVMTSSPKYLESMPEEEQDEEGATQSLSGMESLRISDDGSTKEDAAGSTRGDDRSA